jgi:hypothetical protein
LGGNTKNAYFLKFVSAATGGTVINYSDRFTISGMTGTFSAAVQAGLEDVSGTSGPADENNIATAAPPAATATIGADAYDTPWTLQSGSIRYAPMAPIAPTKITAKNASPQHPTSAYTVFKKLAGSPNAIQTITNPATFEAQSREATVKALFLVPVLVLTCPGRGGWDAFGCC